MINILKKFGSDTFSSLKIRNFRLYFIGQGISSCGNFLQTIALGWLVLKLSNSGTALGLFLALQYFPILILGPWGGMFADRFSKRKILYVTQSTLGIMAILIGILIATDFVSLWMIYAMALILGFVNVVDNPTRNTFISELVGEHELKNAVTINSSMFNLARIIGPTIAGITIVTIGYVPCFILNGISFGAVIAMLSFMDSKKMHKAEKRSKSLGNFSEGFHYVMSKPALKTILIMVSIIGTLSYEFQVILPLIAQNTFNGDARSYAALTTSMGIGAIFGGILSAGRKSTGSNKLIFLAILFGISLIFASIMPSLYLTMAMMAMVGVFSIQFTALGNTTLQLESEREMRGRVMSFWTMSFLGSTVIGAPIIGWIGQHVGPRWGLAIGGVAAIIAALIGYVTLHGFKYQRRVSESVAITAEEMTNEDSRVL